MRIGVTGGSGFIGSHVVDALLGAGHRVMVLDVREPRRPDVEFQQVDIRDAGAMERALRGLDVVFHLAAFADVNDVDRDPVGATDLNVGGTLRVLEAARHNSLQRVVLASTVWVYSSCAEPDGRKTVDETAAISLGASRHLYTSTKLAAEMLCHDYWNMHGLPFTILRYGIPYGPRMRASLVIPIFVRKALAGEPLTITGDGSQNRRFVYAEDLARGHVLALSEAARNRTLNLDGVEPLSILRIAKAIMALTGSEQPIQFSPGRSGDYGGVNVSSAAAEQLLGWHPEVCFEDGLRRTVDWLRSQEGGGP